MCAPLLANRHEFLAATEELIHLALLLACLLRAREPSRRRREAHVRKWSTGHKFEFSRASLFREKAQ